jgi:hypothetical protein
VKTTTLPPLSAPQRAVLGFLATHVRVFGHPPSMRELADAAGLASPSAAAIVIIQLEAAGYLRRDPVRRAIHIRQERRLSACTTVAVRTHVPVRVGLDLVLIPVAGADEVMRAIGRAVWPWDPPPMEDQAYEQGWRAGYDAGTEDAGEPAQRYRVKAANAEARAVLLEQMFRLNSLRIAAVVERLEADWENDDEKWQCALSLLRGQEWP